MVIYDPVINQTTTVDPSDMPNLAGSAACPLEDATQCKVVPIQMLGSDDGNGNFGSDMNPCPTSLPARKLAECERNQRRSSRRYGGTRTYARDG
jgi:hypothetical protein